MRRQHILFFTGLTLLSAFVGATDVATAADENIAQRAFVSQESADADFAYQGEYSGEINVDQDKLKYGVQVIALGDGKFRAVGYLGGLPGDGWNKEGRVETEGSKIDQTVTFKSEQAQGVLTGGVIEIQSLDGESLGKLKKVDRQSKSLGKQPPAGAVVLFDGTSAANFKEGRMTDEGLLMQGATSQQKFHDFELHLEFMLSYMPYGRKQDRSNSGCYMQGRHEVQILDSFGLSGEDNECGGIYTVRKPDVNMCYPPLSWQTYDVTFHAAKFDNDKKTSHARMSVLHNGVPVHVDVEIPYATRAAPLEEGPAAGPIFLQDHNCPVRYRNIWLLEL
jgi:hypothetical protein